MRLEGVWAKASGTLPGPFTCPGETSVHGNGSELGDCKGVKPVGAHWWFVAKTRIRHMIAGPCRSIPLWRTRYELQTHRE